MGAAHSNHKRDDKCTQYISRNQGSKSLLPRPRREWKDSIQIHHETDSPFLISNFRLVLNVVCFLLGNSAASEFYVPTFRNTLSVPSSWADRSTPVRPWRLNRQSVPKRRHIKIQTPGNYPEESIQQASIYSSDVISCICHSYHMPENYNLCTQEDRRGLLLSTMPGFVWRDWGNPRRTVVTIVSALALRSVTTWDNFLSGFHRYSHPCVH